MPELQHTVSLTELRRNFGAWLKLVDSGCELIITRYGKPIALLKPVRD